MEQGIAGVDYLCQSQLIDADWLITLEADPLMGAFGFGGA
jgi:hypothetical protein